MPHESDARPPAPPALPHANAYVVPGTRLIAGEYPGAPNDAAAREKLAACLNAGISSFVDLTEAGELRPYEPVLRELAAARGVGVEYRRLPIRDVSVCEVPHMRTLLDTIDDDLAAGRTVYVHCWGGVGRTGITVGSWLVRHGATGDEALATVGRLFSTMSPAKLRRHGGSPQTREQREFVRQWAAADRP
jgi:protein-tyrosine phosphatase